MVVNLRDDKEVKDRDGTKHFIMIETDKNSVEYIILVE